MMNARSAAQGLAESKDPSLAPLQAMMINVALPVENFQREKGKPVVFFTGDSTVKNADKEEDGMWGWGSQAYTIFNPKKITCVNAAKAGRSSRSYLNEGRWEKVYNSLQPGDYVLIEFGHNDICSLTDKKMRGSIPCAKDTCNVYQMQESKQFEVVYSFGWYLKKFIQDVYEKGAHPILVSLTPRNEWPHGKMERRNDTYGKWYREVVAETEVPFLDLHNIGESGVGKEIIPRVIHDNSPRRREKYFAINCGSIPEGTIDSELFGHEKGSFTGAIGESEGYFGIANKGTIFLDEVGELPIQTQARLLRVLETGEYIRVGGQEVRKSACVSSNLFTMLLTVWSENRKSSEWTSPTMSPVAALSPLFIASYMPWSGSDIIFAIRSLYSLITSIDPSVEAPSTTIYSMSG